MALGGSANTWNESTPADADLVGLGAGAIRSILTNLRGPLDSEHVFPNVGGSVSGIHRKGSAVVFVGAASAVSSTDTDGRLMLTSDTSRLFHVGSTLTQFIGSRQAVEAAYIMNDRLAPSTHTSTVTQAWAMECGSGRIPVGSGNTAITLQHTYLRAMAVFNPAIQSGYAGWETFRVQGHTPSSAAASFAGATLTAYVINASGDNEALTSGNTLDFTYMVMGFRAL
jgi:hypothetical protein